jgi:hypothetical protein
MANGILGQVNPTANTNTTLYTVTSGLTGSFTVNFCNQSGSAALISMAVASSTTPGVTEWLLYNQTLPAYSSVEKAGIVANAGKNVVVFVSTANVSVAAYGYEG